MGNNCEINSSERLYIWPLSLVSWGVTRFWLILSQNITLYNSNKQFGAFTYISTWNCAPSNQRVTEGTLMQDKPPMTKEAFQRFSNSCYDLTERTRQTLINSNCTRQHLQRYEGGITWSITWWGISVACRLILLALETSWKGHKWEASVNMEIRRCESTVGIQPLDLPMQDNRSLTRTKNDQTWRCIGVPDQTCVIIKLYFLDVALASSRGENF